MEDTYQDYVNKLNDYNHVEHKVTLTQGEIGTILYHLDDLAEEIGDAYIPSPEVESIYEKLEGVVDRWYAFQEQCDLNQQRKNAEYELTPFQEHLEIKEFIRNNPTDENPYSQIPQRY